MRLVLVTVGSRGDVQPYLHVGRALTARGHSVAIATHREFEPLVRAHGLDFRLMRAGPRELLATEDGRNWIASADQPLKYAKYARAVFQPLFQPWCEDAHAALEGADAALFYVIAMGALPAAERRGIPAVALAPWPGAPTADDGHLMAPWTRRLPRPLRRPVSDLITRAVFGGFQPALQAYRASVGLPASTAPTPFHAVLRSGIPIVHLYSEAVLQRPSDWEARYSVAGFSFGPRDPDYQPSPELARFLEKGPKPIYVGFGSMTGHSPEALARIAADAARRTGVRMVYARGWAGAAPEPSEGTLVVDEVPHDWLFPRVAAVVHHGGVGTFAEGLRAGRPTVIVPFFADQPWWAGVNARLGTGPAGLPRRGLRAAALAEAIHGVVHEERYAAAAARVARALAAEDGAARAAELVERGIAAARPR